ncbi:MULTISPECIES: hypothetical protein [unclassified Streptomyces]|uniref:hypothetical protein n=1 Tax=unclassified Streptomyces TaxID=2593676 RepID=UPI0023658A19|nr:MULTISPECIES: hypothetical protein [unclassified Streptomyces]MDF3140081.1 hypothetical protein [Streptomyces sp. T21Q-yed]WDF40156.1 hypothetical protein PBV52_26905 [Streptomyces sp. T12]
MVLSISAVLLFGAASVLAVKSGSAGGGAAVVLFLFGFFAAGTGAYEPIHNLVQASADALSALGK